MAVSVPNPLLSDFEIFNCQRAKASKRNMLSKRKTSRGKGSTSVRGKGREANKHDCCRKAILVLGYCSASRAAWICWAHCCSTQANSLALLHSVCTRHMQHVAHQALQKRSTKKHACGAPLLCDVGAVAHCSAAQRRLTVTTVRAVSDRRL